MPPILLRPVTAITLLAIGLGCVSNQVSVAPKPGTITPTPQPATINRSPVIASLSSNAGARTNSTDPIAFSVDATDPDGDTLSYRWTATGGSLSASAGKLVQWTPPAASGTYSIQVLVADDKGGSVDASQTITITAAVLAPPQLVVINRPPVIDRVEGDIGSAIPPGATLPLTVIAHDPDGDALSYEWSVSAGTLSATTGTQVIWTVPKAAGVHNLHVTAIDPKGATASARQAILVPPMAATPSPTQTPTPTPMPPPTPTPPPMPLPTTNPTPPPFEPAYNATVQAPVVFRWPRQVGAQSFTLFVSYFRDDGTNGSGIALSETLQGDATSFTWDGKTTSDLLVRMGEGFLPTGSHAPSGTYGWNLAVASAGGGSAFIGNGRFDLR